MARLFTRMEAPHPDNWADQAPAPAPGARLTTVLPRPHCPLHGDDLAIFGSRPTWVAGAPRCCVDGCDRMLEFDADFDALPEHASHTYLGIGVICTRCHQWRGTDGAKYPCPGVAVRPLRR